ncbi:plasmid maintenance protein [Arthrobacter sp. Soil782]|uniref:type II toxin-antitoxin system tRNA(fMet)-specific endonuclease VapC n=1 Tax=Arthrobacter sp. Soil782 TaxID=1736410 RepID=UPI0006F9AFD0|nr:tRNA(fMet)-specific endonuclease VapC [Arthrobacter sp. Soil782]KRF08698.1 plasmid maintenance protein [Arthrobacter sp. Soil782]
MTLKYLLDTNILIQTIRYKPDNLRIRFNEHAGQMALSSVVLSELVYGAEVSERVEANLRSVEGLASRMQIVDFDTAAAHHTAGIRAHLKREGQSIGPYDAMIAGHARSRGLTVVTNNVREFARVPGLLVENWQEQAGTAERV